MYEIRVLLTVEHSTWVAQCLEYDIAAHGTTIAKAREALGRAFTAQVALAVHHGEEPLATLKPAPKPYWDLFEQGERIRMQPRERELRRNVQENTHHHPGNVHHHYWCPRRR